MKYFLYIKNCRGVPKGNLNAFYRNGKSWMVFQNEKLLKPFTALVSENAKKMYRREPTEKPCKIQIIFEFKRPKSHYIGTNFKGENLRPDSPKFPTKRNVGDIDKLTRAVLDALSGVFYIDDSQVTEVKAKKRYGESDALFIVFEIIK